MRVHLRPISQSAADAMLAGERPEGVRVADDHPTEFSVDVAQGVVEKAAFTLEGEAEEEHEGTAQRVHRWELLVGGRT
jgi:hypothetical protein